MLPNQFMILRNEGLLPVSLDIHSKINQTLTLNKDIITHPATTIIMMMIITAIIIANIVKAVMQFIDTTWFAIV